MGKRKRRPIWSFVMFTILLFIDIVRTVILKMTDNDNFETPQPTLASLKLLVDDLAEKEIAARTGGAFERKAMRDARKKLEKEMLKLGLYIYTITDGDETKMLSSAFPLTAEEALPTLHREFWLEHGANPGEVLAFCKAITKARAYIWMYYVGEDEPELEKDWLLGGGTTKARITLNGYAEKSKVWVRVCGITKDGMTPWLEALHITVV